MVSTSLTNNSPCKPLPCHSNAGGGGERVLWTAIAWSQATHPKGSIISLVYTGDYPSASKDEIIAQVKVRTMCCLQKSLSSVPLHDDITKKLNSYTNVLLLISSVPIFTHPRSQNNPFRTSSFSALDIGFLLESIHFTRSKSWKYRVGLSRSFGERWGMGRCLYRYDLRFLSLHRSFALCLIWVVYLFELS